MQALFDTYKEARNTLRTAIMRYQQNLFDSQFQQLMEEADQALEMSFIAYADTWWDSTIETRKAFPHPHSNM
jgi:hypothetical protein